MQTTSVVPGSGTSSNPVATTRAIGAPAGGAKSSSGSQDQGLRSEATVDQASTAVVEAHRLDTALQEVAEKLPVGANTLEFSVDEESGKTIIRVIDPQTDEVIRQLPPDEVLELAEALDSLGRPGAASTGLLVNGEA